MPTRRPVKLPGPVVTAMRSSSAKSSRRGRSRARSAASALRRGRAPWRAISRATIAASAVSSTAAEQASSAVSMARMRMDECSSGRSSRRREPIAAGLSIGCEYGPGSRYARPVRRTITSAALRPLPARNACSRFWMPCLSVAVEDGQPEQAPFMLQIDDAFLVALEGDVAAVAGHRRAHARLDQVLDDGDGLGVGCIEELVARRRRPRFARHQRRARS